MGGAISLSWQEFLAQVAVLLPLDEAKIPKLEVGGLLNALVSCVLSLFFTRRRWPLVLSSTQGHRYLGI